MKTKNLISLYLFCWVIISGFLLSTLNSCGGLKAKGRLVENQNQQSDKLGKWTHVSGNNKLNQPGVYGKKGVAAGTSKPWARMGSVSWIDNKGNLWLFGGEYGRISTKALNDLWKFDGTNWTWVSGDSRFNQPGVYGARGIADTKNTPGARFGSIGWTDREGNFWLFGGYGYAGKFIGYLNDLWKFDGTRWTWISGDNLRDHRGVYDVKGIASDTNKPGARRGSVSWVDSNGNLWLFGGFGYAGTGLLGNLNDLWKFDGTNWTWISGDTRDDMEGIYGTMGIADRKNKPGSRQNSAGWIDSKGNLWLFGGIGADRYRIYGCLNDLWKFDGTNWTWVSGEYSTSKWRGVYGLRGVSDSTNRPRARYDGVSWTDNNDNLWLFGGGSPNDVSPRLLNDLWKFNGTAWTWVSGENPESDDGFQVPWRKTRNNNYPGARYGGVGWKDADGNLWLFGGRKFSSDYYNDLWKYEP